MKKTNPLSSTSFSSTILLEGMPDAVAVESDMASGSCTRDFGVNVGLEAVACPCSDEKGDWAVENHWRN